MVSFVNTGDWFKENDVKPLEVYVPPYRYGCVVNIIFWSLVTLIPLFYLAFKILISGNIFHIILFLIPFGLRKSIKFQSYKISYIEIIISLFKKNILFTVHVTLSKLVSVSEINKTSSSYGSDKQKSKWRWTNE